MPILGLIGDDDEEGYARGIAAYRGALKGAASALRRCKHAQPGDGSCDNCRQHTVRR